MANERREVRGEVGLVFEDSYVDGVLTHDVLTRAFDLSDADKEQFLDSGVVGLYTNDTQEHVPPLDPEDYK